MDTTMKKILCFIFGHKVVTSECPITHIKLSTCARCTNEKHHSTMSFN